MNQATAVTISWILAACLVLAVVAALYVLSFATRQRRRAEQAEQAVQARAEELEHFTGSTMRFIADSVRRGEPSVEMPIASAAPAFGQLLQRLADQYVHDLRLVHAETRDHTRRTMEYEAAEAGARAEAAVRAEVEVTAREATGGAVRAFGTSVVSLGADVGQVVSAALRKHRSDAVYETLIHIDHSVQQMIRLAQSYVIVCGGLPGRRWPRQTLTDVVGGATGRVRDYTRVRPQQLDRMVVSRAVEPLVHTLATLLDNALRYSPPASFVDVSFQEGHHGATIIVDDAGMRMNPEQMEEARLVLAGEQSIDILQLGLTPRIGFPGIAALARRYGFTVYIDGPNAFGGMRAMVYIPDALLTPQEPAIPTPNAIPAPNPAPREVSAPREVPASAAEPVAPAPEPVTSTVHEITPGGLPRRRRRAAVTSATSAAPGADTPDDPGAEAPCPRPELAAAWHSGSQTGRAAAHEHTEGKTS
jgi:signal transduction histidine kinase